MSAPAVLSFDLSKYPKLSDTQVGHLKHFHNLAFQPDGEWVHMGSQEPAQEFLDAYRYQIATMAYGAAVTHYHRLPALRTVFKPLIRQLIHKMLHRSVWGYWFTTSLSGTLADPGLQKLRDPWADPVVKENIMYSGHLLLMTSLYAMLFDDDEFEKPDSIVFDWNPMFYGMGPERFAYDNRSLQAAIINEMERNGWVGVCCEPNLVFIVCNQFPIIAMRYNDVRDGTATVDDVLVKYKKAWEAKGLVMPDGLFPDWWMVKQDHIFPAADLGFTAWAGAFMNAWNSPLVNSLYVQQAQGFITDVDDEVRLQPSIVANNYRKAVKDRSQTVSTGNATDPEILKQSVLDAKAALADPNRPVQKLPYTKPTFGYVVKWLSELGKEDELSGLLEYADTYLNPSWDNGGLYYPRNDKPYNDDLEWTHMDPFSGNAAIGYSRLNVENGQSKMWENPWTRETLQTKPWVDNLDFVKEGTGIVALRGVWDGDAKALILTVRGWDIEGRTGEEQIDIKPVARNLANGTWAAYVNGHLRSAKEVTDGTFAVEQRVKRGEEVDIVFLQQ